MTKFEFDNPNTYDMVVSATLLRNLYNLANEPKERTDFRRDFQNLMALVVMDCHSVEEVVNSPQF